MKRGGTWLAAALFPQALLLAQVEGTLINGTTGRPQGGASVTLMNLGGAGMEPVGNTKSDAEGRFRFERKVEGPHLLQAAHDSITYSRMLRPGEPATGLKLEVFDASPKPRGTKVTTHMILLEPGASELSVNESVIYRNDGKLTWNNEAEGTLRLWLPAEAGGIVRVLASAPQGMPLDRPARETKEKGVRKVDFPVKPGETRFDISYAVPFQSPGTFAGRVLQTDMPARIVAPPGVTLKGDGIQFLGQEPATQASIYEVSGREYKITVEGSGSLREAAGQAEEEGGAGLQQIRPRLYDRLYVIVGLALLILLLGLAMLYRKQAAAAPPPGPESKARRR